MLCIPIFAKNTDETLMKMDRAGTQADILEIRLDMMETFDLDRLIAAAANPLLITYRTKEEGGRGSSDPSTYSNYVLGAIRAGADLVDLEYRLPKALREKIIREKNSTKVVISIHILDNTPPSSELERIFKDLAETGADVIKIVTFANTLADNFRVLDLIPRAHELGMKIMAFCMGPSGKISRVFSHLLGGYMTFASLEEGDESAAGQIPVTDMKKVLEVLRPC